MARVLPVVFVNCSLLLYLTNHCFLPVELIDMTSVKKSPMNNNHSLMITMLNDC